MKHIRFVVIVVLLVISVTSCGKSTELVSSETSPTPTSSFPQEQEQEENIIATPTEVIHNDPSPTEEPVEIVEETPSIPNKSLSQEGPWLILKSWQGLFAVNPDGSGLTQFVDGIVDSPYSGHYSTTKQGGYFAYQRTSGDELESSIRIVSFPSLELVEDIPLFSYSADLDFSAMRAVREGQSMVFSPDDRFLAFMGVIGGPSSDLYLYSMKSGEISQLTDGRTQGYQPVWSPDSKNIVHTGTNNFGTGAGFETTGIWAAQTDGSVQTLYTPSDDAAEEIIGWVDNATFLVSSWSQPWGINNLRTYNINSGKSKVLWSEPYWDAALDPVSGTVVLTSWDESNPPEDGVGAYFIPVSGKSPVKVIENTATFVSWSSVGNMFFVSDGLRGTWLVGIDTNGQFVDMYKPEGSSHFPVLAPESQYLAWTGESLYIGTVDASMPTLQYYDEPVDSAIWTPDGEAVIFVAESGLYIAHGPDFLPVLISADIAVDYFESYMEWLQ